MKMSSTTRLPLSHFRFHPISQPETSLNTKKLVVLYAWLFAPEQHLDKYRALYQDLGYDVLSVRVNVKDFLFPKTGVKITARLLVNYLLETSYEQILFHGFSVGVYLMGEVFLRAESLLAKNSKDENENTFKENAIELLLNKRIIAIIMDSPVDVDWASTGISMASTSNCLLQLVISGLIKAHLRVFYNAATKHYLSASEYLRANERSFPVAMLHSKDDPMTNWEHIFAVVDRWKTTSGPRGVVVGKCWESSPHASHYYKHPKEYTDTVVNFLELVDAVNNNSSDKLL